MHRHQQNSFPNSILSSCERETNEGKKEMIYMVEVKVETIRHVTVDAATIDEAEQLGLQEAKALVGGIDGTVLEVYSNPKQLIGEEHA